MVENCNLLKNYPILKVIKNQKKCKKFQILNLTPIFDSRFRISMKFSIRKFLHLLSDQPKQVSYPCWLVCAVKFPINDKKNNVTKKNHHHVIMTTE